MPTLAQIRQEVSKRMGRFASGTATGGSTTTLVAANNALFYGDSNTPSDDLYPDWWILPTSGNESGNIRRVKQDGFAPATGTFTVPTAYAWGTGPANTDTFELHGILHPTTIKEAVNRALRKMHHLYTFPLTLVPDGTMDEVTNTANWTASNASLAKTTTQAQVLHGTRALSVTASSANGYAQSDAIAVEENKEYYAATFFKGVAAATTPKLVAYDVTGSAEIDSETWTTGGDGGIQFAFTTPSSCRSVKLRLQVVENSKVVYFDNAILLASERRLYPLPSFVLNPEAELQEIYRLKNDRFTYHDVYLVHDWEVFNDITGQTQYNVRLPDGTTTQPYWVQMWRRFDELSADSDASTADLDWVSAGALMECYKLLRAEAPSADVGAWEDRLNAARSDFRSKNRRFVPRKAIRVRSGLLDRT